MSAELKILKLFCNKRGVFETYFTYIKGVKNLDKEVRLLLSLVKDYYLKYTEQESINIEDLLVFYDLQYPIVKDRELHKSLIAEVFAVSVSDVVLHDLLEQMLERHFAAGIVNTLIPVVEGNKHGVMMSVLDTLNEYLSVLQITPEGVGDLTPNTLSLMELTKELSNEGLDWHIEELNNIVGRVKPKTLGLIYAFVDSGKTSFSLAACANFAKQLGDDECILYAGNEEASNRLNIRLTQGCLNVNRTELLENPEKYNDLRIQQGFDKIKLFDSINTVPQIDKLITEYKPSVVFVDQATNIEIDGKEDGMAKIKRLFILYREMAKRHNCAIIGVAQGTGEAENKKWLKLSDIYGSRVAIQGALDYCVGIGRIIDDAAKEHLRYLNIPKNKLLDGAGGKIVVNFMKEKCLWGQI